MWRKIEDDRIPMLPSAGYFFWWLATTLATRTDKKQGPRTFVRMKKGSEVWTCLFTFMHFIIIFSTMHKQMTKCGSERGIWCCRSLPLFCKYYPSTLPFLLPCTFVRCQKDSPNAGSSMNNPLETKTLVKHSAVVVLPIQLFLFLFFV
ncbi:hypothetical protein K457DRAFT_789569 [Linnemannia elongata AG-77]|uniref:Uncharacterized protein n=1 Tax=Linnemannia elongata AG-77 TaxID=1314771 RepID=A0A197JKN6_9FUNG|nr:hypothetical protein K457DRAFT_789569 [Linnemannia elongata AG-77]